MVKDIDVTESYHCPICNGHNDCCYSAEKSKGICWCSGECFPQAIFDLVPADQLRKSCICKRCLDEFKC